MRVAFFAQGVSMCLSILQKLLVPKMLGVEQYGYWQLYIFYISYVGFSILVSRRVSISLPGDRLETKWISLPSSLR